MTQVDRRSALAIGVAAASAAMVKPAAAQTTNYKDTTVAPGVVNRVYGETPAIIPGFKTVSLRDIIIQPGSKTVERAMMMDAMVCHITEGELQVVQQGHNRAFNQYRARGRHHARHRPEGLRLAASIAKWCEAMVGKAGAYL